LPKKKIAKNKAAKIKTVPAPLVVKGTFIGNERGFGFVVQEDLTAEDIFVPPSMTGRALHGDEVVCRLTVKKPEPEVKKKGRRSPKVLTQPAAVSIESAHRQTGEIVEVTLRKPLIGTFYTAGQEGFVRPIERKIPYVFTVSPKSRNRFGLADGHRVIFLASKPKRYNDPGSAGTTLPCSIVEVMGHASDPGIDVLTLVRQFGIPYQFPEDAQAQAAGLPDVISEEDLEGRLDLRDRHIITIDGEDTKDIDDAVSLTQTAGGYYQLGVHIADVSHYVKPDTPIDTEALNRGTSVYLADRVIPMLPHRISSGICSLFPGVDRLTLSCMMTVNAEGDVVTYEIAPSVINSKRRWTYSEVQDILDASHQHKSVEEQSDDSGGFRLTADDALFVTMDSLREILFQKRHKRGALDFDLPEAKIRVDENGHPISVEPYKRNEATGIIEEFMILANETIATHCQNHDIPLIYRAHDAPAPEKFAMLSGIAKSMGFAVPAHSSGPKAIQNLLETAGSSPAYYALAMAALTSLPQAIYTPTSPRHFGLASEAYCHFTSPIRRYADLQVHRIVKESVTHPHYCGEQGGATSRAWIASATPRNDDGRALCGSSDDGFALRGSSSNDGFALRGNSNETLVSISAQCSRTEREAEALEREVAQLKKIQFMQNQVGGQFEGTVSGITPWGVYVMLANTIEGLIPSQHLKRHDFTHDKDKNRYVSKRTRASLSVGANVNVRLANANMDERKLDFTLCEM